MQRNMTPISRPLSPQVEARLQSLPTEELIKLYQKQATNPTPGLNLTMILGEINNRKLFEQKAAQPPTSTVAQDVVQSAMPRPAPIMQAQAPVQPQAQPQQPVMTAASGGVVDLPVPDHMFQEKSMAGGGIVAFDDGGHVPRYAGVTDGSLVSNPYYFNPSAPGVSAATLKYRNALQNTELSRIMDYVGAGLGDLATIMGKFGYDYDHYKKTGELKRKSETMGFFPRFTNVEGTRAEERAAREAGIDQKVAADRAQFEQYLQQPPNLNTPRAGGQTPTEGPEAFPFVADPATRRALTAQNAKKLGIASVAPSGAGGADMRTGTDTGGATPRDTGPGITSSETPATRFQLPIAPGIPRTEIETPDALSVDKYFEQQKEALKAAGIDPEYFSKKRTEQEKRVAELGNEKKQAGLMALSEFGFRLAGSKSPYFGQAAGEAGVGALQTYSGELKDLKKREDALKDAMEKNEDAKYLLARGDADKAQAAIEKRDERIQTAKTKQAEIDARREEVTATLANQLAVTGMNNQNAMTIAKMQINGQMQVARLQRELGLDNAMAQTLVSTVTKNFETLMGTEYAKAKVNLDYVIPPDFIANAWATAMAQAKEAVTSAKRSVTGVDSAKRSVTGVDSGGAEGGKQPLKSFYRQE